MIRLSFPLAQKDEDDSAYSNLSGSIVTPRKEKFPDRGGPFRLTGKFLVNISYSVATLVHTCYEGRSFRRLYM